MMKGIVIDADNTAKVQEFSEPAYKSIGAAVGGWIEIVHPRQLPSPYCMIVNDEGLLRGLPLNMLGSVFYETGKHGHPIVGNIVLVKDGYVNGERDIIGLDDDDLHFLATMIGAISNGTILVDLEVA